MRTRTFAALVLMSLALASCQIERATPDGERVAEASASPSPDASFDRSSELPQESPLAEVIEDIRSSVVNVRVEALQLDPVGGAEIGEGQGSGVVIDRDGIIVTNNHVVQNATDVEVVFGDEHGTLEGEVIGTAPDSDIAVIQVDADDLDAIEIGRSGDLRLGDDVAALGFPLGLGGITVTRGIVSGLNRTIQVGDGAGPLPERLENLLQTDAAINPGNSGGALIDMAGNLIGINTAAARAGSAENLGFAIPIDAALPVIEEIIKEPPEQRAWLGVQIESIDSAAVANQAGLPSDARGALIVDVFPEGAAADGGLEPGDLITEIDGEPVASVTDLTQIMSGLDPEQKVDVEVLRDGDTEVIEVTLDQRPVSLD